MITIKDKLLKHSQNLMVKMITWLICFSLESIRHSSQELNQETFRFGNGKIRKN